LLVLDQFEDVFKFSFDGSKLWDKLAEAANVSDPQIHILISMREEWLGAWGDALDYIPSAWQNVVRLPPLSTSELARAVTKPLDVEGTIAMEAPLVEELLRDLRKPNAFGLGGEFVEPGLLQLVCRKLWDAAHAAHAKIITNELYVKLGRADAIIRNFVWDELSDAGNEKARFGAFDRVTWCGLTRHLVVAQGIKSIVSVDSLCRKLRLVDLGFTGEAVSRAVLPASLLPERLRKKSDAPNQSKVSARAYIKLPPERRGPPPEKMVEWINSVVTKGVEAGFLKRQTGSASSGNLFELSHDSLGPIFQQFALEFEVWMRVRATWLVGSIVVFMIILPIALLQEVTWWEFLVGLLIGIPVALIYFLIIYFIGFILRVVIIYPILRWLCRGRMGLRRQERFLGAKNSA
jgi:hypothetical protein